MFWGRGGKFKSPNLNRLSKIEDTSKIVLKKVFKTRARIIFLQHFKRIRFFYFTGFESTQHSSIPHRRWNSIRSWLNWSWHFEDRPVTCWCREVFVKLVWRITKNITIFLIKRKLESKKLLKKATDFSHWGHFHFGSRFGFKIRLRKVERTSGTATGQLRSLSTLGLSLACSTSVLLSSLALKRFLLQTIPHWISAFDFLRPEKVVQLSPFSFLASLLRSDSFSVLNLSHSLPSPTFPTAILARAALEFYYRSQLRRC